MGFPPVSGPVNVIEVKSQPQPQRFARFGWTQARGVRNLRSPQRSCGQTLKGQLLDWVRTEGAVLSRLLELMNGYPVLCFLASSANPRKDPYCELRIGGFKEGPGFLQLLASWVCFANKSVIAREFLLEFDTLIAMVTSGLRTNLLLQEHPRPNTPFDFLTEQLGLSSLSEHLTTCKGREKYSKKPSAKSIEHRTTKGIREQRTRNSGNLRCSSLTESRMGFD